MIELTEIIILVPVIVGLVEVIKRIGLPSKFAPAVSVVLGVGGAFALGVSTSIPIMILGGIVTGLASCGLYSSKAILEPVNK